MNSRTSVPVPASRLALRWIIVAILVIALLIGGALTANRFLFSAQQQVTNLQHYLVQGDGARALGLMQASVPQGDAVALDGEVLQRTQDGITEFAVDAAVPSDQDPDLRLVTAHYKAAGVDKESTYTLRHTGKNWLFFDTWAFEPSTLPTVQIKANTVNEVNVNQQAIPLEAGTSTLPVFYPAVLDASFSTKNFEADTRGVVVTGPSKEPVEIALKTQPTKEFIASISAKVKSYLDECATQQVLMPSGCPFAYNTTARVDSSSIAWSIDTYPTIEVSYYNGAWILSPLEVKASVDLVEQDLRTGTKEAKKVTEKFSFTAQLTTSTTEVSVVPVADGEQEAH